MLGDSKESPMTPPAPLNGGFPKIWGVLIIRITVFGGSTLGSLILESDLKKGLRVAPQ